MILGHPSAARAVVEANLPAETTTLFEGQMLPALWAAAVELGVDPVGVVAQSGKETGWGAYPGRVKPWFYNTAGIKVRDVDEVRKIIAVEKGVSAEQWDVMTATQRNSVVSLDHPLVHSQFGGWDVGALAHCQHLRAYCNIAVLGLVVDPRYVWVIGKHDCVTWADLGGRWAPSPSYGTEIEAIIRRLRGET